MKKHILDLKLKKTKNEARLQAVDQNYQVSMVVKDHVHFCLHVGKE